MFYNEEQFLSKKYFLSLEEGHFKEKMTWKAPNQRQYSKKQDPNGMLVLIVEQPIIFLGSICHDCSGVSDSERQILLLTNQPHFKVFRLSLLRWLRALLCLSPSKSVSDTLTRNRHKAPSLLLSARQKSTCHAKIVTG